MRPKSMRPNTAKRLIGGVLVLAGVLVLGLAQSSPAAPMTERVRPKDTFAVGDSVMLGAHWWLERYGVVVDAKVSRPAATGPGLLWQRRHRLPHNIAVHLGTNGTFQRQTCDRVMRIAGPGREVFWVTLAAPRGWIAGNNRVLRACVARYPGRAHIVDWAWAAARHPAWLYDDRIHLRPAGAKAFTRILRTAIDREAARESTRSADAPAHRDAGHSTGVASGAIPDQ